MAPKRLLEKPPPADSSSEDEYESDPAENEEEENGEGNENGAAGADDEEEKSGGDEEEEEESPVKKPTVSKSDDSGSSSDTESDDTPPSPSLSGFTIKPIVSKPMDDTTDKPKKKSSARPNKRATESEDLESETSEKDSKRKKKRKVTSASASITASKGGGNEVDSKKSSGFARLWSEDDEIAILKGMTDYKAKKSADPYADMGAFHDFIKKSLNVDVSKSQLVDKIRRLKKKYLNNAAKGENDEDPVFSKPHELLSFKLSKKIWGIGANKSPNGNNVEDSDLNSRSSKNTPVPSTLVSKSTTTVLTLPSKEMSVKKDKKREQVEANGKVRVEKEEEDGDEEEEEENGEGNENGAAGADDEEEKSGGDEEEEDESPVKKPTVSKSDDSGPSSDTESDDTPPSPSLSGFTIKPVVSKPMDDTADKPKKKSSARPNKRATESEDPESETSEKDSKRKKKRKVTSASASVTASKGGGNEVDSKKSSGFARLWSEDDEIAILKGMTDYKAKKSADPYADMGAFHDFIKKSLNVDVSKSQLVDKIRRLKKKYLNNAAKGENDEDPVFSKPHELLSFKLSKKIWGIGANKSHNGNNVEDSDLNSRSSKNTPVPSTPVSKSTTTVLALPNKENSVKKEKKKRDHVEANGKVRVAKEEEEEDEDEDEEEEEEEDEEGEEEEEFWDKYPHLKNSLESSCFSSEVKTSLPLVETSKLEKLDKKWRELHIEELGLFVRKAHLSQEQAELVLGVLKSVE